MVVSKAVSDAASPTREMSDDSSINELSRLLLQGWTMLADTCPRPNCHMPLARSRTGRVVCTHCHADVVPALPDPASPPVTAPVPVPVPVPVRAPAPPPRGEASRAGLTAALGQKLLQGWTLMDDACRRCSTPLVRDERGRVVCVACEEGDGAETGRAAREETTLVNDGRRVANSEERRVVNTDERRVVNHESGREEGAERRVEPVNNAERRVERVERRVEAVDERRVEPRTERRVERVERRVGNGREPSVGAERRTTTVARVEHALEIDVDDELRQSEEAAGRTLRSLRARLSRADDAEACRIICAAMTEACNVIRASRQARGLPRGV